MSREFKIDMTLAADIAIFLEALLAAEFNEEFDSEEPCTDTFLDQFMPNGVVPNADLIAALKASGIVTAVECKHTDRKTIRTVTRREFVVCNSCNKVI